MEKPKVSICMIVKDEEMNLERCLDSFLPILIEPWVELVVVDTGSKDRTIEVAKNHNATVYEKTFTPWNFSDARNYGIGKANGEWIFILDADEELAQECLYELKKLLFDMTDAEPTKFLWLRNIFSQDHKQYTTMKQPRIFLNDGDFRYDGSVHNKPNAKPPFFWSEVYLNHYGYKFEQNSELAMKKYERSLPLLLKELEEKPHDTHVITHIIKTYRITQNYDKVIEYGLTWIKEMKTVDYHHGWFAYLEVFIDLVDAYLRQDRIGRALLMMRKAETYSDRLADMYLLTGAWYAMKKEADKAAEYYERAMHIIKTPGEPYEQLLTSAVETSIPRLLNWLSIYYFQNNKYKKAGEYVNEGIQANIVGQPMRWDIWNCTDELQRRSTCYACGEKLKDK